MHRTSSIAAALTASFITTLAWADEISNQQIHELLVANACSDARSAIESADNREQFLSPPYGRMLYGGSVCCSSVEGSTLDDITRAETDLNSVRGSLGPASDAWIDSLLGTCERARMALRDGRPSDQDLLNRRRDIFFVASTVIGKVLGRCQDRNVSPLAATKEGREERMAWIVPGPNGESQPSSEFMEELLSGHLDPDREAAVCPPFVAISGSQDPARICTAAHRFLDFFDGAYGVRRPPVWIALYHYPRGGNYVYKHALATGGPTHCQGMLGYFNWQLQEVVWSAPEGFFGTFDHELAHALMFWDAPLLPRWFDEGIAGLYENATRTDKGAYIGIENPWRQELLRERGRLPVTADMLKDVMRMTPLDFESDSLHATIARESMRNLQDCGKLPAIYTAMREESRGSEVMAEGQEQVFEPYPDARIAAWQDILGRDASGSTCW